MRHAIAAERGDEWPDDTQATADRARHQPLQGGRRRAASGSTSTIDEIFTSPLVRAKQTAELLAAGIDGKPTVKIARRARARSHPGGR